MNNCIFCKIIKGEISSHKIYEDSSFFAFLDATPVNKGHVLVIPKKHYSNLYEVPDELLEKISSIIKKTTIAVKKSTGATGMNIINNNEVDASQTIFHYHVHIIPRFKNDGLKYWPRKEYKKDEAEEIAKKIKNKL